MSLEAEAYFHAKLIEHTEEYESALDQHGDNPLRCISAFLPEYPHALEGLSIPAEGGGALIFEVDPTDKRDDDYCSISYLGYDTLRTRILSLVAPDGEYGPADPFWDMLHMSDCDGMFSTEACARIADDFETWYDEMEAAYPPAAVRKYAAWGHLFARAAANEGIVVYG